MRYNWTLYFEEWNKPEINHDFHYKKRANKPCSLHKKIDQLEKVIYTEKLCTKKHPQKRYHLNVIKLSATQILDTNLQHLILYT